MDNINNYGFLLLQKMLSFTELDNDKCKEIVEEAINGNEHTIKELAELTNSNEDTVKNAIDVLRKTIMGQNEKR